MGAVTVPAEFFRGELRVYGDWREAISREMIQNSVDAGARRIDVTFTHSPDGRGRLIFRDDGHGMSRATLQDVFFALGRSSKTGGESIGGFGRARIIVCFAQHVYTIRSGHLLAEGQGGQYTITTTADREAGCTFTIDLIDDSPDLVEHAMRRLLRQCSLEAPVYINGSLIPGRTLPARAARVLRDPDGSPWARVYVLPDSVGNLHVQVRGLVMFSRYLPGDDDVLVQLLPGRAREILTASRDQLAAPYQSTLDEFVDALSSNRKAALLADEPPLDVRVDGGGFLATFRAPAPTPNERPAGHLTAPGPDSPLWVRPASARSAAHAGQDHPFGPDAGEGRAGTPGGTGLGFDVYLHATTANAPTRRLARVWNPATWTGGSGARRRALLLAWKAAVAYALDVLVELHPEVGGVTWTVGWVLDPDVRALHRCVDGGHVMALNPTTGGRVAYRVSSRMDRRRLLALAAHEVAHVVHDSHREDFAELLTTLYGALDDREADGLIRAGASGPVQL